MVSAYLLIACIPDPPLDQGQMVRSPFIPTALDSLGLYPLQVCAWRYLSCTNPEGAASTLKERDLAIRNMNNKDSEKADNFFFWKIMYFIFKLLFKIHR